MIEIADINMDNVNIEIQSSSEKASQGVNTLIETLNNLNSALSGVQNNVNKYLINMNKIANAGKNMNLPTISKTKSINASEMSYLNSGNTGKNSNNQIQQVTKNAEKSQKAVQSLKNNLGDLGQLTSKISGRIGEMFKKIGKTGIATAGIEILSKGFSGFGKNVTNVGTRLRTLAKHLAIYAGGIFGIRSAFYAVKNSVNEFLSSQNAVAQQLNANISYLKYAIGASLTPVITFLTNLVYSLLKALQYVVYYFSKINIFANASAKSMKGAAGSAGKTTKELQKQLQAFDELNNITLERNAGSGGGAGGGVTPSFDLTEVDTSFKDLFDDIDNWGWKLAEKINRALSSIDWQPILDGAERTSTRLANILNDFTRVLDFRLVGYTIAQGFNTVLTFIDTFFQKYDWSLLGHRLAEGFNSIVNTLQWDRLGRVLTDGLRATILTVEGFVSDFNFINFGQKIGEMLISAFRNIPWDKAANAINLGLTGILDAIIKFLDTMPWNEVGETIGNFLNNIEWGEIFSRVLTVAAKAVEGLGKILWSSIFSGDGDLAKVLFLIVDFVVLKKLFSTLFTALGKGTMDSLVQSMSKTNKASKDLSTGLKGAEKATVSLKSGLNNLMTSLGKSVQIIAVFGGLKLVIDSLSGLLKSFAESGLSAGEALGLLGGTIGIVTVAFSAMMLVMDKLKPSWQGIAGAAVILGGLALVLNQVTSLLDTFAKTGMTVNDVVGLMLAIFVPIVALMGAVALIGPAMTAGLIPFLAVVAGISALLLVLSATLPTILDAATNFVQGTAPSIVAVTTAIFNGIQKIVDSLGKTLPPIINSIGNVFNTVFNGIVNITNTVGNVITTVFTTVFNGIANIANTVGNIIINVFKEVNSILNTIFNGISTTFTSVFNGMANVAQAIGNVISSIFYSIGNVATAIGNAIRGILNSIAGLINSTLNGLLNFAWQIGPAVENSVNHVMRAVRSLVNFVVSAIEYLVNNVVVRGMNSIIDTLNKLPAVNISRASTVRLPRFSGYAEGGFPTEGDLFIANEAGAEMVGSIGNKTAVANNDQITKAIADATYQAISQALGENSESGQPIVINIGNETIYKGIARSRSEASNQYGVTV